MQQLNHGALKHNIKSIKSKSFNQIKINIIKSIKSNKGDLIKTQYLFLNEIDLISLIFIWFIWILSDFDLIYTNQIKIK